MDDLQLNILFPFLQLIKALLGGGVYNAHLDGVQHIGNASLRFLQLLAERREYAALLALYLHHGIGNILHETIIHHFRHDSVDNSVFNRQLSDALVLGVAGLVLLGIHAAVIMIFPALAGTCPAFAYHHGPTSPAKQLCGQKIVVLGLVTGRGFLVCFKPLLYPVKKVLGNNSGDATGGDDMTVTVFPDILSVFQHTGDKVEVDFPSPYRGDAVLHQIVHDFFHGGPLVVPGERLQHNRGGAGVYLVVFVLVDGKTIGDSAAVVFAFQSVFRMAPDDLFG